jgi:hypothetical protein
MHVFYKDLALKEEVLAKATPITVPFGRFRADDHLLAFLANL